jgi:hypothetical protein
VLFIPDIFVGRLTKNKSKGQPIGFYRKPVGFYRQLEHFSIGFELGNLAPTKGLEVGLIQVN